MSANYKNTSELIEKALIDDKKDLSGCDTTITFYTFEDYVYPIYTVDCLHKGINQSAALPTRRFDKVE